MAALPLCAQIVCLLSILSLASAQVIVTPFCSAPTLVTASADLQNIQQCQTFGGDLTVSGLKPTAPVLSGPSPTLSLGALQDVTGSLEFSDFVSNGEIRYALNGSIASVGELKLTNMELAKMPDFPNLGMASSVTFDYLRLDNPSPLKLPALSTAWSIILNNTDVTQIGPFGNLSLDSSLGTEQTAYFVAANNPNLVLVDLSGYANIAADIDIRGNAKSPRVALRDVTTGTLRVSGVQDLEVENLATISTAVQSDPDQAQYTSSYISGNAITTLSFPKLTNIASSLAIENNWLLSNLKLPQLLSVSSLSITNNSKLDHIDLPSLDGVTSSLNISGPINILNMPHLSSVSGNITVLSTGSLDCREIDDITQAQGQPSCTTTSKPSSRAGSGPTYSASPVAPNTGSGGLSTGAKAGIGVGVGLGALLILAGALFLCIRKRRSSNRNPRNGGAGDYSMTEQRSIERSPVRYTKVPVTSGSVEERSSDEQRPVSSMLGDNWSPPEQTVPTAAGRVELEEQQGPRHEMDARSLPDMDMDDDEEETRSLQDIERAHGHQIS